jgi:pimeloyl-ACP methyl ester carboxylesterase
MQFGHDVAEFARGYASLADSDARAAFLQTLRGVIDIGGQRVSALDRLYLAEQMPMMVIWGSADPVIPVDHGRAVLDLVPSAKLVELEGAGHFPQLDEPYRVARELGTFLDETEPYEWDLEEMRAALRQGPVNL